MRARHGVLLEEPGHDFDIRGVVRGYLSEEERDNGAAIKKAIEGVISDLVFELQSETAERTRAPRGETSTQTRPARRMATSLV